MAKSLVLLLLFHDRTPYLSTGMHDQAKSWYVTRVLDTNLGPGFHVLAAAMIKVVIV